jgi:hypothetical protein
MTSFINNDELRARYQEMERLVESKMELKKGDSILEAKGWHEVVKDIPGDERKMIVACMLENNRRTILTRRNGGLLAEDLQSINVGNWEKFGFPIISMVGENLIAPELVNVQTLPGPSGNVFYMDVVAGSSKGSVKKGDTLWSARGGHGPSRDFSSERVMNEQLAVQQGGQVLYAGNLGYAPIRPGTLVISNGADSYTDNANGTITGGSTITGMGTVDYVSGAVAITLSAATPGQGLTVTYYWNSEGSDNLPMVNLQITSSPIYAVRHALRVRWSFEAEQVLQSLHGLKAETQLTSAVSSEIQFDIDRTILAQLWSIASAGTNTWDATPPMGVSFTEHQLSFINAINELSGFIFRATTRVMANWVVVGIQGMLILINHPLFEPATLKNEVDGITFLGTLNKQYKVYVDPHVDPTQYLVGHKSENMSRIGFIFAPWLLLYSTETVALDDLTKRKGFASSYGQKVVNAKYYAKGQITNYPVSFGGN